jgi:hypothetical protein
MNTASSCIGILDRILNHRAEPVDPANTRTHTPGRILQYIHIMNSEAVLHTTPQYISIELIPSAQTRPLRREHLRNISEQNIASISTQTTPGSAYTPRQLDVLLHNRDPFRMNGAEICVFKKMHQEGLCCFLKGHYGLRLPTHSFSIGTPSEGDFTDLIESVYWGSLVGLTRTY